MNALAVPCPHCAAPVGSVCRNRRTSALRPAQARAQAPSTATHLARITTAARGAA
jgi:hypothetical protein